MFKKRRIIGIILALSLSINIISPATVAFASKQGVVNAESKLKGVTYKMRPDVITMPEGISYELEEEEVLTNTEELDSNNINSLAVGKKKTYGIDLERRRTKRNIPSDGEVFKTIEEEPRWNSNKEFLPKSLKIDRNTNESLTPKIGKIYYDAANQSVMKVIGDPKTDASGMTTIPVEQPEVNELIEDLNIPEQTIPLSNDSISYINDEVRMMTDIYSQSTDDIKSLSSSGREPMVEIDLSGLDLIDMNTDKDHKKALEDKLKAIDDNPNLNGYAKAQAKEKLKEDEEALENERESELKYKAKVEITEGTIKIYKPTLTAYAKWGFWGDFQAEASANIDVESDLLIDGDLNISKQVEILIYGYDIDFDIGKFYAGVYLVVGLNGQINFQIRVQQEGTVKVGVKAVGWLVPMAAYPVVEYDSKKFETAITASGELKLWAHAMPKAGIELFGFKVLSASFRVGLEANVKLELSSESQSVRLWIDMILQLNAVVFGNNIDILDKRFNIYDRTWAHTKGESIDGGTDITVGSAYAYLNIDKVDAMRDIIRGTVFRSVVKDKDLIPCSGENVRINITNADGKQSNKDVKVNSDGSFVLKTPITPLDRVGAYYFKKDNTFSYEASIPLTNVPLPYSLTYLYPDAFNSRISGEINGEKYGPDEIANNGDEVKFTKPIDIIVEKADKSKKTYKVTPNKVGEFSLENVELNKGDKVFSQLVFEDAQVVSKTKDPELGLEIYLDLKKDENGDIISITGAIQNMYGSDPYLEDVVLVGAGSKGKVVTKAKAVDEALGLSQTTTKEVKVIKGKTPTKQKLDRFNTSTKDSDNTVSVEAYKNLLIGFEDPLNTSIGSTTRRLEVKKKSYSSPSSLFEFKDIEYTNLLGLGIQVEHNGVTLYKELVQPASTPIPPTLESAVVSPAEAYIDARINHAYNKNMKSVINTQKLAMQKLMQNDKQKNGTDINFENHGVFYTMSMIAAPATSEPQEYSFMEGDIKLVAKSGANSISLTWNKPKDSANIKGYNVYRGTEADGESLTPINSSLLTSPKYTDKKMKAKTKYYYLCSVVYDNGDEFIISNEASAIPRITKGK